MFRIFGGFLHVPVPITQIYRLTGAIISETHKNNNITLYETILQCIFFTGTDS
jgi:hypothetical protein